MIQGRELIGSPVFSLEQGKKIGKVKNLVFDPVQRRIIGLILREGGWFHQPEMISFEEIEAIGPDAVVLRRRSERSDGNGAMPTVNADELKESFNLTGRTVISEDGQYLGEINDLYIDETTGEVFGFELTQGLFRDTSVGKKYIQYDHIQTIGEDVIVVKKEGAMEVLAQKGGLSKTFDSLKESGSGSLEKARETLQNVKEAGAESLIKARGKSEVLAQRVREKSEGIGGRILEKKESWGPSAQESIADFRMKSRQQIEHSKRGASRLLENLSADFERGYQGTKSYLQRLREQFENHRVEQALGRRISRTILDPSDQVILQQGDIITHQAIRQAREIGALDSILNSVIKESRLFLRKKETESAGEEVFSKRPPIPGQKGERLQKAG
jgi:uncharacterized protein YrrD